MSYLTNPMVWGGLSLVFFVIWFLCCRYNPGWAGVTLAPDDGFSKDSIQIGWMYRTFVVQNGWGNWHFVSTEMNKEMKPSIGLQFFPVFDEIRNDQNPGKVV